MPVIHLFACKSATHRTMAAFVLGVCLSSCTPVGPDYHPPQASLPASWSEAQNQESKTEPTELKKWWRAFNDPVLDQLIERALKDNQDLAIAQARLQQARAQRIRVASAAGPAVSAGGLAEADRDSRVLNNITGGRSDTWRAGVDVSWELDIFGGTRRAVESAEAEIGAVAADREALQVSLLAEIADDYVALRVAQMRLAIARDKVVNLRKSEQLAERARQRGLGSSAEVLQARAEREAAEAEPAQREAEIARYSHAIGVLAGGFPGDWKRVLTDSSPGLPVVPVLPQLMPSEVIRQRPDLRADERRLASAMAKIGVAEAMRYPHFSIPLGIGTTASLLHDLFSGASLAWSAGMQSSQMLYDGGRVRAEVKAAEAEKEAARLTWERDVRFALRDVEDSLTLLNSERQRTGLLTAAVTDSQQALSRTMRLYRQGLSAYLPVLVAQRSANQALDALAVSQGEEIRSAILLYKALGAGWQD